MKKNQVKKVYTVEQRLAHVAAYNASGKSLVQYAKDSGVNDQTLYNWAKGRNLTTQAKKREAKRAETQAARVITRVENVRSDIPSPTVIQVPCPRCARYEKKVYVVASVLLNLGILAALVKVALAH
jgi:transposase-like protein